MSAFQLIDQKRLLEHLGKANVELASFALTAALTGLPNWRSLVAEMGRTLAMCSHASAATNSSMWAAAPA
nr:hypothetical protein [uncultured Albidiferax sp.]